jgi:hypothetical protein
MSKEVFLLILFATFVVKVCHAESESKMDKERVKKIHERLRDPPLTRRMLHAHLNRRLSMEEAKAVAADWEAKVLLILGVHVVSGFAAWQC